MLSFGIGKVFSKIMSKPLPVPFNRHRPRINVEEPLMTIEFKYSSTHKSFVYNQKLESANFKESETVTFLHLISTRIVLQHCQLVLVNTTENKQIFTNRV